MKKSFVFIGNTTVGEILSERLLAAKFRRANSAEDAGVIFIYCDTQTDLEDAFLDSAGLVHLAIPGTYLINLSVSTPEFARELDAVALVNDLHLVEAPLFVKNPMAERAFSDIQNLSCFIAGSDENVKAVMPLLKTLASELKITGISGSAQLFHTALTILRSSQLIAGIEVEALYASFSQASDSVILTAYEQGIIREQGVRLHSAIKKEEFSSEYTVAMWMAHLSSALMTADDCELILPGAEACLHLLELLVVIGGESFSAAALSLVYGEEELCARHGLDWTKAEQAYAEDVHEHHEGCECGYDHGDDHNHDGFPQGFSSYSAN